MIEPKTVNHVWERGVIIAPLKKSHKARGKMYWKTKISCKRRDSEHEDVIPVILSEKTMKVNDFAVGDLVAIHGLLRSVFSDTAKSKVRRYVYAFLIKHADADKSARNIVELEGTIVKTPVFRTTPRGAEITDLKINTGRDTNVCVCWAANAHKAKDLLVGQKVCIRGSIQSRDYRKNKKDGVIVFPTIEVSVYFIETVGENEVVKISSPEP